MSHIILHIGHEKTGTSHIQSILSLNVKKLEQFNIYYPFHNSFNVSKKGYVSSGNGSILFDNDTIDYGVYKNILLSHEKLHSQLLENDNLEKKILSRYDKVSVILYTRNVLDLLCSTWGQAVKKKGLTKSINDFLISEKYSYYSNALEWINLSKKYNFKLHIKNYSNHKNDIFNSFSSVMCNTLELDEEVLVDFIAPSQKIVNRSMSLSEYVLIQSANRIDPNFGNALSDALVNNLPNILSEVPIISHEVKMALFNKYEPIISELNKHIEKNEFVKFESESSEKKNYSISEDQLEVFEKTFKIYFTSNDALYRIIKNNIINLIRAIKQKTNKLINKFPYIND